MSDLSIRLQEVMIKALEVDAFCHKLAKGGAGSGDYGHEGRPGEVGGSSSEGGVESIRSSTDLSKELSEKYGVHIHVADGVSPQRADAIISHSHAVISSLSDSSPLVAQSLRQSAYGAGGLKIEILKGKMVWSEEHQENAFATYQKETNTLKIASGLNTSGASAAPHIGNQYNVGTDFRTVMSHEIGHAVSGKIVMEAHKQGIALTGKELFDSKSKDYWRSGVSKYSAKNSRELMAESFAAYTHPGYGQTKGLPKEITRIFEAAGIKPGIRKILDGNQRI